MGGKRIDWDAIHREYRADTMSNRALAAKYGPSEGMIRKVAKREGWEKDLSKRVKEQTRAKLTREEKEAEDSQIVEEAASRNVAVIRQHRRHIGELISVGEQVLSRLKESVQPGEGENGQQAPMKPADVRFLCKGLSDVSTAFHKAIVLERQAFNIDDGNGEGESAGGKIKLPGLTILIDGPGNTDAGERE